MTQLRILILSLLLSWLGADAFAQVVIYQQNFDGNNGSFSNAMLSEITPNNGWRASSTAAQYAGAYRHVWNFSTQGSGNFAPVSSRSLGIGLYNGNNPNYTGSPFRTWSGTNCSLFATTYRWAYVPISTVGYQNITVEFKWRCSGEVDAGTVYDYGTVNTSIDGGATWLMDETGGQGGTTGANGTYAGGLYYNNSSVLTQTISLPANRDDQPNFALAFRMVVDECYGTGGGFIIDDIIVRGTPLTSCFAGTASGPSYVATGGTANLTLSGYVGTTIQWQSSPNGTSGWTNVSGGSGATTDSYTTGTLANGTYYYRAVVTDGASCTEYSNNVEILVAATPPYCSGAGNGNAFSNNHLESIGFHEWSDPNPGNYSNNYLDYTDTTTYGYATVVAGQYHHLSALIRANGTGTSSTTFANWIDWNGDGTFNNTAFSSGGERMDNLNYTSTVGNTYAGYFTVPSTASGTVRVRMRVVRGNQGTLDPCTAYTYAQTKDFTVKILPTIGGTVCNGVNGNANNVSTNSTTDKVNISRVHIYDTNGTVLDNSSQFFGVQAGSTITMYNYTNFMGSYSNGFTLEANNSYTIEIEHSGYTTAAGLFIDYNGDGDFADANELVARASDPNANPFVFNFTVPANVIDGKQVAVRVRLYYDNAGTLGNTINSCNNITDGFGIYSEVEDYRVTLVVPTLTCAPVTGLNASIGNPANGTQHYLDVSWNGLSGATAYDLHVSPDGTNWAALGSFSNTNYSHNTGDNPNKPYYFRVRAKDATQFCPWATMATPRYTAADVPATPVLSNVGNSIDITLPAETPMPNPAITTYSIKDDNTGLYVQANGTLGASEVFQTKAQWSTVTVTGLTATTEYCFVAKARNADGHEVGGSGSVISAAQQFNSNVITTGGSGNTSVWWAPNSNTPIAYSATGGCTGGRAGYSSSWNNFWGNFLRSPQQNCTGLAEVKMTFDVTHSYLASQPNNRMRFYMYADGGYTHATSVKIGGVEVGQVDINGIWLYFSELRNCVNVEVTFDLSSVTNKSNILYYIEGSCGYNNSNVFSMWLDNITFSEPTATACATTTSCTVGTWTGIAGDNDWNNPANWSCNTVPTSSIDVTIPSGVSTYPILATIAGNPVTGYTRNLNVAAAANVNINAGGNTIEVSGNLTYNGTSNIGGGALRLTNAASHTASGSFTIGTLTVEAATTLSGTVNVTEALNLVAGNLNASAATLTLKSNASTTAYINDFGSNTGTITGNVTVERFVSNTVGGFHYVGAPVGGTNIADWGSEFNTNGPNNVHVTPQASCNPNALEQGSAYGGLFDYRESAVTTCYQRGWRVRSNGNLSATDGYAGIIPNNTTIDLTGTANTGNINSGPLTRTPANGTTTQGMHLVSNPYPSALDWYQVSAGNTDLDGTAYLWLTSGGYQGTYQPINAITPGSSFIGSSQGFFVEALANAAVLNFDNTMRVAGNNNFARQGQAFDSRLILEVSGNGYNDRTIVAFGTDFTHGYDREFDGKKMQSKGGVMTLYTTTNSNYPRQATNALPNDRSVKVVPVGFAAGATGTFTFSATDLGTFPVGTLVFLEDLKTGTMTNLMRNPDYTFSGDQNDAEARFLLHFIPGIEWSVASATCLGNDGELVLDLGASEMNGTIITWDSYEIVNENGDALISGTNANGTIDLNALAPGTYTVNLEHDGYTVTQDITVAGVPLVDANATVSDASVIEGEVINFNNMSDGATSYTWNFGDGNTSTDVNPAYSYNTEGIYTVTLTATNGTCTDIFTQNITVSKLQGPTGIDELTSNNGIQVYGFERTVTVRFNSWNDRQVSLDLFDLTGRKVIDTRTLNTNQSQHQIVVNDVVTGYYFVRIQGTSGVVTERIFLGDK